MSPIKSPAILIVDDEAEVREFLKEALIPHSGRIESAANAKSALAAIESGAYDVVISDICMPGVPGVELLRLAQQSQWDLAVILMTGRPQIADLVNCLRLRASDFLIKPFSLDELTAAIGRSCAALKLQREVHTRCQLLDRAIQRRTEELQDALGKLHAAYHSSLEALVVALDAREHETYAHSFRVRAYASHLAKVAGYPPVLRASLSTAALLHDVGKITVPDHILLKPGSLSPEEFALMKHHAVAGAQILERIKLFRPSTEIVRHHHERFDGAGYPDGLKGEMIPLGARIFAVADTLDAMTSDRCYRKALPYKAAREEIERCSGTQFDPRLASAFLHVPESVWSNLRAETDYRFRNQSVAEMVPTVSGTSGVETFANSLQ